MTIRTKLSFGISLILAVSAALLGWGVVTLQTSFYAREEANRLRVMENSVQRAAQDALLQKDDLLLISYITFLKQQFPSLAYVNTRWEVDGRARDVNVGSRSGGDQIEERTLQVVDPSASTRRVTLTMGVDRDVLVRVLGSDRRRLIKTVVAASLATIALGVAFSLWFAYRLTMPLKSMASLAAEIGSGKLGGRLEWSSDDELGGLVKVFNAMSQRLEDLDETKKNFVSSVTHELRSPLGAIESFLHLIKERIQKGGLGDDQERLQYLDRIQVNVQRLSGFINDLLDVAKIEKGKMECVLRPMNLQDVATEVCQFFEAKSKQQGVSVAQQLGSLPPVMGDADRLRQVLVNLISNSLKFTPAGGKVVIVGEQFREGNSKWVEIAVRDTGRGMEQRDLTRLFKAFSQGRNVAEGVMGPKGTGLGLYIAKSIIDQHGGKIEVKSEPGKGTQIAFSLQLA